MTTKFGESLPNYEPTSTDKTIFLLALLSKLGPKLAEMWSLDKISALS